MYRRAIQAALVAASAWSAAPAQLPPHSDTAYRVNVEMVVLSFSVSDGKGRPVTGLQAADVRVFEDDVRQKVASFAEGSRAVTQLEQHGLQSNGASVFVLFDTSNHMYRTFPYVCDAIADFVRRLDPADSVAIYTFSRNLSRAAPLTRDHGAARAGLSNAVAGDDTALFNSLLLTIRDAARVPGRKAIVVFSNGPDNASVIAPDDVGRVAEDEGVPIHVISTAESGNDRGMTAALQSITARTGGTLQRAHTWQQQAGAFAAVREEIESSYTVSYYPLPSANQDFHRIRVEVASPGGKSYHIRARAGYQPHRQSSPN